MCCGERSIPIFYQLSSLFLSISPFTYQKSFSRTVKFWMISRNGVFICEAVNMAIFRKASMGTKELKPAWVKRGRGRRRRDLLKRRCRLRQQGRPSDRLLEGTHLCTLCIKTGPVRGACRAMSRLMSWLRALRWLAWHERHYCAVYRPDRDMTPQILSYDWNAQEILTFLWRKIW